MTAFVCAVLAIFPFLVSSSNARPTNYDESLDDSAFSRWRRPFFNPYPSWVSFLKQVYSRRHGIEDPDQLDKRPFFNVFPHRNAGNGFEDVEET